MTYVTLGATAALEKRAGSRAVKLALPSKRGFPPELLNAVKALDPLLLVVKAHRQFVSRLFVQWVKDDRGLPGVPGYEKGRAHGGGFVTKVAGKSYNLKYAYDTLRLRSREKDPKYDVLRAAGLALIIARDPLHVANSAIKVLRRGGLGETAQDVSAAANEPVQDIDWSEMFGWVEKILPVIQDVLDQLLSQAALLETASAPGAGQPTPAPSFQPEEKPFPIVPVAIGLGVLALVATRKK